MADIRAFRAFRYDLGRVGALRDVVAPPYDVIDPELQRGLYERSPYNVVRLILNAQTEQDTDTDNRYTRSAQFLRDWQGDGILTQDSARSLYVYHQEFEVEGRRFVRRGFLARVRLEPFGTGNIFPHEETMSGPKEDRLKLFRATGMNLSPIFGLYPDDGSAVQAQLDGAVGRSLPLEATDHLGVVSRLWPVHDQQVVSAVTGMMGDKPIFIADGHHRYETALKYREEMQEAGELRDEEAPANFVLMMLVGMSDPGLTILPTHRLIRGLDGITADRWRSALDDHFEIEVIGKGDEAAAKTWEHIETAGHQELLGFCTAADQIWMTARLRSPQVMAVLAADHSVAWRNLGVSVLHVFVLDRLAKQTLHAQPECRYVHLLREVQEAIAGKQCDVAALVPPASMRDVEQIAGGREKMPPKSTYFYPKLLSGLVFNPLKTN